jgi:hypothetical protein
MLRDNSFKVMAIFSGPLFSIVKNDWRELKTSYFCVCFSSSRSSKLTNIKVKYFILVRQRRCRGNILVFLDVKLVHIHSNTSESQCTTKSLVIMIGK